jgi:hypothetical protein
MTKAPKRIGVRAMKQAELEPVTMETHLRRLAKIRDSAYNAGVFATALAAEKARGQIAGFYIERKEILHGKMDTMSSADILKEIKKLVTDYPELQVLIDTQPRKKMLVIEHEKMDREGSVASSPSSDEAQSLLDEDRNQDSPGSS